jgi:pimeloyl-ACP methyl ester carboxylesterase
MLWNPAVRRSGRRAIILCLSLALIGLAAPRGQTSAAHAATSLVAQPKPTVVLAAYLASLLRSIAGPIVLVGHSYGGAVITNAAAGNPGEGARLRGCVHP